MLWVVERSKCVAWNFSTHLTPEQGAAASTGRVVRFDLAEPVHAQHTASSDPKHQPDTHPNSLGSQLSHSAAKRPHDARRSAVLARRARHLRRTHHHLPSTRQLLSAPEERTSAPPRPLAQAPAPRTDRAVGRARARGQRRRRSAGHLRCFVGGLVPGALGLGELPVPGELIGRCTGTRV